MLARGAQGSPGRRLSGHRRPGGLGRKASGTGGGRLAQRSGRRRGLPPTRRRGGEWNAYSAPQLEDGDVDELLDDLADVAPPDAAGRGRRRARGGPTSAGSPRALTPRSVSAAVGGGREFTPAAAGTETAGCRVGGRGCSGGQGLADVAVEAGHREPDLAATGGLDDALSIRRSRGTPRACVGRPSAAAISARVTVGVPACAITDMICFSRSVAAAHRAAYIAVSWSSASGSPACTWSRSSTSPAAEGWAASQVACARTCSR